jgi:uncharacterized protein (TIGR00251 family)
VRLKIKVSPKGRANEVVGWRADGAIHVRVTAAPESGKANEAVLRVLQDALGLPRTAVRIVGGAASREKWVELDGIDEMELKRRLEG